MIRRIIVACALLAAVVTGEERFATLDGAKVRYMSYGAGKEAVVFIHGWTCDLTFWRMQAPVYQKRRSILIDLPGHGGSDKPDLAYTMDYFAQGVDAVLRDAGVDRATLVGHSMGVPVAVAYLRLYPEKVAALVIVDGRVPQPPKDPKKQAELRERMTKLYRAPDAKQTVGKMIVSMFSEHTPPAMRDDIRAKMLATPSNVMASAMEGMMAMKPVTETWPKLPVLAIMTKRGDSSEYQDYLKAHFDLRGYVELEGAGHFLMMEFPERFNTELLKFLVGQVSNPRAD
jgi:pimeloyl-ACP methyl ester carboxylesterase